MSLSVSDSGTVTSPGKKRASVSSTVGSKRIAAAGSATAALASGLISSFSS